MGDHFGPGVADSDEIVEAAFNNNENILINGGGERKTTLSFKKFPKIGPAAEQTDTQRCLNYNHYLSPEAEEGWRLEESGTK
jgi:hypothetical protein